MKTTIPPITYHPNYPSKRCAVLIISTVLASFAFLSPAQAVSPPPDGGYANRTTVEGQNALFNLTTGTDNTALGFATLWNDTTGSYNTATGEQTLYLNVSGIYNTATGYRALYSNTGSKNTANGFRALYSNTAGEANTASGFQALFNNTLGLGNTALGSGALYSNTTGFYNTGSGEGALSSNTTGHDNNAYGDSALYSNTTGNLNNAYGNFALSGNRTGSSNTALGHQAMYEGGDGSSNVAVGYLALFTGGGSNNTAIGSSALYGNHDGSNNIALGTGAGSNLFNATNDIYIGSLGNPDVFGAESNTIRIGTGGTQTQTFIAGISGTAVSGAAVVVSSGGQLGVASSSARFKEAIKPMDKASEALLSLRPVTFRYKKNIDLKGAPQFGLVAEDVEKVDPDLVVRDADGKPYTVRYEAVNAMLLNEFLKEHRRVEQQSQKIQEQEATITELKRDFQSKLAEQQNRINVLASGLEKVTAQLALSKAAPQTVFNDR